MRNFLRAPSLLHLALAIGLAGLAANLPAQTVVPAAPGAVAVPVAAATPDPAKTEIKVVGTKVDPKDPDAIVCKWEMDTGSRTKSTKVCASRRQWTENGREVSKQFQNQGNAQSN